MAFLTLHAACILISLLYKHIYQGLQACQLDTFRIKYQQYKLTNRKLQIESYPDGRNKKTAATYVVRLVCLSRFQRGFYGLAEDLLAVWRP